MDLSVLPYLWQALHFSQATQPPQAASNRRNTDQRTGQSAVLMLPVHWNQNTAKLVLSGHSKEHQKYVFKTDYRLMQVCNLTCTKLPPVFKTSVLSIFEWPLLRHDSLNKVKNSWKHSCALAGNQTRVNPVQNQCSNHWAKESTLTQLSEIDFILEAMRIHVCRYIGESAWPITPLKTGFTEVQRL